MNVVQNFVWENMFRIHVLTTLQVQMRTDSISGKVTFEKSWWPNSILTIVKFKRNKKSSYLRRTHSLSYTRTSLITKNYIKFISYRVHDKNRDLSQQGTKIYSGVSDIYRENTVTLSSIFSLVSSFSL